MIQKFLLSVLSVFSVSIILAQETLDSIQKIDEILIQTKRLENPLLHTAHTVSLVSTDQIYASADKSVDAILQSVMGVDVRRRGVDGMQSDLYIRGGNFNQTLLLIDGIKMDDLQSGHHMMNGIIDIENIDRIEVIKGAASRIYGQNAMNGAVNIITKNVMDNQTSFAVNYGSFENYGLRLRTQQVFKNGGFQFQIGRQQSDGYRYNTDFTNWNSFLKTTLNNTELLFSYGQRAFGANGFYASPDYKEQFEETQTHLLAVKQHFVKDSKKINASLYWRRNQDNYVFLRDNPDYYNNLHINNKLGVSVDATFIHKSGQTGLGIALDQGYLVSNNLDDHQRFTASLFLEHQLNLANKKLQITPGVALVYYSDFNFFAFPGIDIGYFFSKHFKLYSSTGYTSRIPTYTNLFYTSPAETGNPDLKPERAFTYDVGLSYHTNPYQIDLTYFNRNSYDLIDWVKNDEIAKWQAINANQSIARGVEFQMNYLFNIRNFTQKMGVGMLWINDKTLGSGYAYSRYSLNSYKQRLGMQLQSQFFNSWRQFVSYSYTNRLDGQKYHLLDVSLAYEISKWTFRLNLNNILDTDYTETNLVPMPKSNFMMSLRYKL